MNSDGDCVWIICRDYHSEGLGEPLLAIRGEDDARATYAAMCIGSDAALALFRVPIWPDVVQQVTRRVDA